MEPGGTHDASSSGRLEPPAPPRAEEPATLPPPAGNGTKAPDAPQLPPSEAKRPVPLIGHGAPAASTAWYRGDQQRSRSVYRRANPWYRRVARGVIGLALLVVVGAGLYLGAQAVQDYIDRDQLPAPGTEAADFQSTSFLVTSSAPAPAVAGTYTLDVPTGAFEFVGELAGPQAGIEVVSPDGSGRYVRRDGGAWQVASSDDPAVAAVVAVIPYLAGIADVDDVLDSDIRKGYVFLVDQTTEGVAPDARERYEMTIDTLEFSTDYPLQWLAFQEEVVPAAGQAAALPLTMWIDDDDVVVRLRDEQTNWEWERLAYSDDRFVTADPTGG